MSLCIGGQPLAAPEFDASAPAAELFQNMCKIWKIEDKVGAYLVEEEGLTTLDDFVHRFTTEEEIASFVKDIPDVGKKIGLATSRLRQAWQAAKAASVMAESKKRKGVDEQDLDILLPERDLSTIKESFYARYKLRFPLHDEPCDKLVSRLTREIARPAQPRAPGSRGPRRAAGVNLEYSPCLRYATWCISSKHRASASALATQWRSSAMRGGAYSAVQRGRRGRAHQARGVQG